MLQSARGDRKMHLAEGSIIAAPQENRATATVHRSGPAQATRTALTVMRSSARMPPCGRSAALTGCRNGRTMTVPGPHGAVMTGLTHRQNDILTLPRAFAR